MRPIQTCQLFSLALVAAGLAVGSAGAASAAIGKDGKGKEGSHAPAFYVKEGDKFRPATDEEVKAAATAEPGHGEGGGLGFAGLKRYDLGIYTLIVFGILMFVLAKFAWPPMREGLERRESNIKSALEQARQSHADAAEHLDKAKRELNETSAKVKAMLDDARRDADTLKASERETGAKEAQAERERAKREIEAAKDALSKEVYEQAVTLAALMAEKAIRREVKTDDHRRLLDESLAELKSASKA